MHVEMCRVCKPELRQVYQGPKPGLQRRQAYQYQHQAEVEVQCSGNETLNPRHDPLLQL